MNLTKIAWTRHTLNPCTGCEKISAGCANCYAEGCAERWNGEGGFAFKLHPERLQEPYKRKKPTMIFICSMSDLFYREVPDEFIIQVFKMMEDNPQHQFQILTKRPERMLQWFNEIYKKPCPDNVWLGVTVEYQDTISRIAVLKQIPAKIRFISFEPLIGAVQVDKEILNGINWVIVGGESGPKARIMMKEWVDHIYDVATKMGIPFFFKQWGIYDQTGKRVGKRAGKLYNGQLVQEFPKY